MIKHYAYENFKKGDLIEGRYVFQGTQWLYKWDENSKREAEYKAKRDIPFHKLVTREDVEFIGPFFVLNFHVERE